MKSDCINVSETETQELASDRADLFVTVRGSSFFTGQAALHKAREVAQLVSNLTNFGLAQSDIQLQSVTAETASGVLGKTSAARNNAPPKPLKNNTIKRRLKQDFKDIAGYSGCCR